MARAGRPEQAPRPAEELMVRCAWLYYEEGLTQREVAERLGIGRVRVNQLLKRARESGIVRISVHHPATRLLDLEARLRQRFGLERARVVPTPGDPDGLKRVLGKAAAAYLEEALRPGDCLGVTWGTTVYEAAQQLRPVPVSDLTVVQMTGGLTPDLGQINPFDIARRVADVLGARCLYLYAPMFVSRAEVCDALMSERFVAQVLARARRATRVLSGVGEMGPTATFRRVGYLDDAALRALVRAGAVGSMLARFFDAAGRPVASDLDRRTVAIRLEELRAVPDVILVAGGPPKVEALRAALRGGYARTLITDAETAQALLAGAEEGADPPLRAAGGGAAGGRARRGGQTRSR